MTLGGPTKKDKTFFLHQLRGVCARFQDVFEQRSDCRAEPESNPGHDRLGKESGIGGPSPQMCPVLQGFPWPASLGTVGGCTPQTTCTRIALSSTARRYPETAESQAMPTTRTTDGRRVYSLDPNQRSTRTPGWLRLDHRFSDKTTFYARAQRDVSVSYAQTNVSYHGPR